MQVIENYAKACPKNTLNVKGKCYNNDEIVRPVCGKDTEMDKNTGLCITTHPSNTPNFVPLKGDKCPTDYTKVNVNNSKDVMCAPTKYITERKCDTNFQEIDKEMCWTKKSEVKESDCAQGDKFINGECMTLPIPPPCPLSPFTGSRMIYDEKEKMCK
jgi:hypothetical protein